MDAHTFLIGLIEWVIPQIPLTEVERKSALEAVARMRMGSCNYGMVLDPSTTLANNSPAAFLAGAIDWMNQIDQHGRKNALWYLQVIIPVMRKPHFRPLMETMNWGVLADALEEEGIDVRRSD